MTGPSTCATRYLRRHPPGMDQILAGIGDTIGDIFESPVVQFGLRMIGALPRSSSGSPRRTGRSATCSSGRTTRSRRTSWPPGSSCSPRSSSSSRCGSTRSSGRTRRSARSGSATWPRRRSSPRSRRSTTARPASGGSTRNGSSARPAGPASIGSAQLLAGSSAWTGRCAPGAARTSSGVRSPAAADRAAAVPASSRPAA